MQDPKDIFKKYCQFNDMRYTPERAIIIEEVYREDEHFDADDLFLRIRNRYKEVKLAKGSIYRTLPHLIKAGLIRESFMQEGRIYYEHILGHSHHDHMKCLGCGKIFEFYEERIDKIQAELCKHRQFKMLWHTHVLAGYCVECQKEKT